MKKHFKTENAADVAEVILAVFAALDGVASKSSKDEFYDAVGLALTGLFTNLPFNSFWQRHGGTLMGGLSAAVLARVDSYGAAGGTGVDDVKAYVALRFAAVSVVEMVARLDGVGDNGVREIRKAAMEGMDVGS